ncbi:hypothetical protein Y032_0184g1000 [Ancylostoma ceylanicum]|nr:hypothetical protein Y032_0184g1000 [Ancylostoma ceylanicum]
MDRYVGPVNPAHFPQLTISLCGLGLFFMGWFLVYEVRVRRYSCLRRVKVYASPQNSTKFPRCIDAVEVKTPFVRAAAVAAKPAQLPTCQEFSGPSLYCVVHRK